MRRIVTVMALLVIATSTLAVYALGAEKVKFGTPLKINPLHSLPMIAAEERGFWKEQGVDVEWFPFKGGGPLGRAVAGGAIDMAEETTVSVMRKLAKGLPILVVADVGGEEPMFVWVLTKSPIKTAKDLKGTKIGITRRGGLAEAYGKVVAKGLHIEGEMRLVAAGGIRALGAAIKSGAVDGILSSLLSQAPLKFRGEIREVVAARDFLPGRWSDRIIYAHNDFAKKSPDPVRRVIRGFLQATEFINKNRDWSVKKMQSFSGYSQAAAEGIYPIVRFKKSGRIDPEALQSVLSFLHDNGLISSEEKAATPVGKIYTTRFLE